jgi:hypothetical protein
MTKQDYTSDTKSVKLSALLPLVGGFPQQER